MIQSRCKSRAQQIAFLRQACRSHETRAQERLRRAQRLRPSGPVSTERNPLFPLRQARQARCRGKQDAAALLQRFSLRLPEKLVGLGAVIAGADLGAAGCVSRGCGRVCCEVHRSSEIPARNFSVFHRAQVPAALQT